jgi:hypothetical protein
MYQWMDAYQSGFGTTDAQKQVRNSSTKYKAYSRACGLCYGPIGTLYRYVANLVILKDSISLSFAANQNPFIHFVPTSN